MATFKDAAGKTWPVVITTGTLLRCKAAGFDLPGKMGDFGRLGELVGDPITAFRLFWVVLRPDRETPPLTEEEFAERFTGEVGEAAALALGEAVVDFYLPSKKTGGPMKAAIRQNFEGVENQLAEAINSWNFASPLPGPSGANLNHGPSAS